MTRTFLQHMWRVHSKGSGKPVSDFIQREYQANLVFTQVESWAPHVVNKTRLWNLLFRSCEYKGHSS